jgi:5'-nucleotidase
MSLILVSNDDGIHSEGLQVLAEALHCLGEVVVVAPDREQSATSHSLTMHRPLRISRVGDGMHSVDGTPTDCIVLAVNRILGKKLPDLVISGINKGPNLGDDIVYSGTVSAAMEGARLGVPSVAVSLATRNDFRFDVAADFAVRLAEQVLQTHLKDPVVLNVNVPNIPKESIRGVRVTRQGKRVYDGAVVEKTDPRGRKYYWIGGQEPGFVEMKDSDIEAVLDGWISITPLRLDLTDDESIGKWHAWGLPEKVMD